MNIQKSLVLAVMIIANPVMGVAADSSDTRSIMQQLYESIAYLIPFSTREATAISDLDQELLDHYLNNLVRGTEALQAHGGERTEEFALLAKSTNAIAAEINQGFRGKWPRYAYFPLMELAQHCVSCHSRLPGDSLQPLGQRLLARVDTDKIGKVDLVNLLIATREFDTALGILERELLDPTVSAADIDYSGLMLTYLRLSISVRDQVDRPRALFVQFLRRPDVPHYLKFRIQFWIKSLTELRAILLGDAEVSVALEVLESSDKLTRAPGNRIRAVHDLVAANVLRRFLRENPQAAPASRAEAYYQLGIIALRSLELNFSVPEMEYLFISAIEAMPTGPRAQPAYRLLEEFGYVDEQPLSDPQPLVQRVVDMEQLRERIGID